MRARAVGAGWHSNKSKKDDAGTCNKCWFLVRNLYKWIRTETFKCLELSQSISACRGILPILMSSYSSSQLFSLVNFQRTGTDFQKIKIDISYLAWNVCIENDRLHPNPPGMKNAKLYLALWHSTTIACLEKWSQRFLTTVSGMGFDTNLLVLHQKFIPSNTKVNFEILRLHWIISIHQYYHVKK